MVGPPSSWSRDQEDSIGRLTPPPSPRQPVAPSIPRPSTRRDWVFGGSMFMRGAAALLVVWLVGVSGLFETDSRIHALLLVGLLLLLIGVLKTRDATAARVKPNVP